MNTHACSNLPTYFYSFRNLFLAINFCTKSRISVRWCKIWIIQKYRNDDGVMNENNGFAFYLHHTIRYFRRCALLWQREPRRKHLSSKQNNLHLTLRSNSSWNTEWRRRKWIAWSIARDVLLHFVSFDYIAWVKWNNQHSLHMSNHQDIGALSGKNLAMIRWAIYFSFNFPLSRHSVCRYGLNVEYYRKRSVAHGNTIFCMNARLIVIDKRQAV